MIFKTIKIQSKKGHQAITIPKNLQIDDDRVYLKKVGNSLVIIPFHNPWKNMLDSLDLFTSDYLDEREQPGNQLRESFD